jgi:hypothetical protein
MPSHNALDLTGQRFGHLIVIDRASVDLPQKARNQQVRGRYWNCICDCGNKRIVVTGYLRRKKIRSCGCMDFIREETVGKINGEIWGHITRHSSLNANARGCRRDLPFTITKEYVWELFIQQVGKCALSGLDICFGNAHKKQETTASLDRIDNTKGYIKGNVQWVHKDINRMKNVFAQDYFIGICKLIAERKL